MIEFLIKITWRSLAVMNFWNVDLTQNAWRHCEAMLMKQAVLAGKCSMFNALEAKIARKSHDKR